MDMALVSSHGRKISKQANGRKKPKTNLRKKIKQLVSPVKQDQGL